MFSAIPITLEDGSIAQGQYVVRGRVRGEKASGSFRAYGSRIRPDGTKVACDTGSVRWTATRGR